MVNRFIDFDGPFSCYFGTSQCSLQHALELSFECSYLKSNLVREPFLQVTTSDDTYQYICWNSSWWFADFGSPFQKKKKPEYSGRNVVWVRSSAFQLVLCAINIKLNIRYNWSYSNKIQTTITKLNKISTITRFFGSGSTRNKTGSAEIESEQDWGRENSYTRADWTRAVAKASFVSSIGQCSIWFGYSTFIEFSDQTIMSTILGDFLLPGLGAWSCRST